MTVEPRRHLRRRWTVHRQNRPTHIFTIAVRIDTRLHLAIVCRMGAPRDNRSRFPCDFLRVSSGGDSANKRCSHSRYRRPQPVHGFIVRLRHGHGSVTGRRGDTVNVQPGGSTISAHAAQCTANDSHIQGEGLSLTRWQVQRRENTTASWTRRDGRPRHK